MGCLFNQEKLIEDTTLLQLKEQIEALIIKYGEDAKWDIVDVAESGTTGYIEIVKCIPDPKKEETPFNFDLERMKKAVESPSIMLPTGLTAEQICEWMNTHKTKL